MTFPKLLEMFKLIYSYILYDVIINIRMSTKDELQKLSLNQVVDRNMCLPPSKDQNCCTENSLYSGERKVKATAPQTK